LVEHAWALPVKPLDVAVEALVAEVVARLWAPLWPLRST
jgi:hypothetical protein